MLRKKVSKTIGGLQYDVTQLGGISARNVLLRLTKCVGPSLGAGLGGDLPGIFSKLELSEADLAYLCDTFGACTFVHQGVGKMPRLDNVFDDHFAGRTRDMMSWLQFAVEVNYSDFFDEAKAKMVLALAKLGILEPKPSPSKSQDTSTGSSGDSHPTPGSASPSAS